MDNKKDNFELSKDERIVQMFLEKHKHDSKWNLASSLFNFLTTLLIIGSIFYFFSAYSVETYDEVKYETSYEQQTDGDSSIINGNSYDGNSVHNDSKGE